MEINVPVLLITGSLGAGKTSVAAEVSELLDQAHLPHAYVDIDALRWGYFPLSSDRFHVDIAMKNLNALWSTFLQAGARQIVIADVVEEREHLERYRQAISGAELFVVRLHASFHELERRLQRREVGSGLDRHLQRTFELARKLERACVEDMLVNTEGKSVTEVAHEVLQRSGWLKVADDGYRA